jgi:cob(I)alamin adenosyltransferase
MGAGFTWETQNRAQDIALARQAWEKAREMMRDPSYAMVILDELNIVLRYDFLPLDDVLAALVDKLPDQHVVITGRNAPEKLIEAADLVTEMTMVKHPFREQGIKAQIGVEF